MGSSSNFRGDRTVQGADRASRPYTATQGGRGAAASAVWSPGGSGGGASAPWRRCGAGRPALVGRVLDRLDGAVSLRVDASPLVLPELGQVPRIRLCPFKLFAGVDNVALQFVHLAMYLDQLDVRRNGAPDAPVPTS
jgi:hypothetical protein